MHETSLYLCNLHRCIEGLVRFAQPILDGICRATGWKATLIAGGPEPAHGGRLNIISIHSGTTSGDVKFNFGRSERLRYKKYFVPMYADFLRKCYTPEECRACALPEDEFEGLLAMSLEENGVNLDSVGVPGAHGPNDGNSIPCQTNVPVRAMPDHPNSPAEITVASVPSVSNANNALPSTSSSLPSATDPPPSQLAPTGADVDSTGLNIISSHSSHNDTNSPTSPVPPTTVPSASSTSDSSPALNSTAPTTPDLLDQPAEPTEKQMATLVNAFDAEIPSRSSSTDPWDIPMPHPLSRPPSVVLSPNASPGHSPTSSSADASKRPLSEEPDNERPSKRTRTTRTKALTGRVTQSKAKTRATTANVRTPVDSPLAPALASNMPDTLTTPAGAPLWLKQALATLTSQNLGTEWTILVQQWLAFEMASGYQQASTLKTKNRPAAVGQWVQRGRSPTWRPVIKDAKSYGTLHLKWWTSLQPDWRLSDDNNILTGELNGDWEPLRKPGANGILGVLASLFYWGLLVKRSPREGARWSSAVADCSLCLSQLV